MRRADTLPAGRTNSFTYRSSWFDFVKAKANLLPWPTLLTFLALSGLLLLAATAVQWRSGGLAPGRFYPFQAWLALQVGLCLWFMGYLDRAAEQALVRTRPALQSQSGNEERLRYRLTHLPALPAVAASACGALFALLPFNLVSHNVQAGVVLPVGIAAEPASVRTTGALLVLSWWCLGALIAHTIHQLRVISGAYERDVAVNLFDLGPLYAFSAVTVRTAVGLLIFDYAWFAVSPGLLRQSVSIGIGTVLALLATATFFVPLLGIHGKLAAEKERLLAEAGRRVQATASELYGEIDAHRGDRAGSLKETLVALDVHTKTLERIPTWPWQPDTFRLLLTALLLPLTIFIIQLLVQRLIVR